MRPTLNRFALPLILPLILALGLCPFHLHAAEYDEALKAISSDLAQCFDQHQRVKVAAVDLTDPDKNGDKNTEDEHCAESEVDDRPIILAGRQFA